MGKVRRAIRWRIYWLQARIDRLIIALRSRLFLFWYRDLLGVVEGGNGIQIRQRTRIAGPGRVIIGNNVRFGYKSSPSWKGREVLILTKFENSALRIGDNSTINNNCSFVVVRSISLGRRCLVGHDCQLFDSEMHSIHPEERHTGGDLAGKQKDVVIADNVMIGAQVTVGPGTEIDENCVVGIRSHVRWKNYPANLVISGNPARVVMKIDDLLSNQNVPG